MDTRSPKGSIPLSRRELLFAGGLAGFVSLASGTTPAQQLTASAETVPAAWFLVSNGTVLARFARLDKMELAMEVPAADDIAAIASRSPLPGKRKPPSVVLRKSPHVAALRAWIQQLQSEGATSAMKTVHLVARDANGRVVRRFRLRNAFPSQLAVNNIETDPSGSAVELLQVVCRRVELL